MKILTKQILNQLKNIHIVFLCLLGVFASLNLHAVTQKQINTIADVFNKKLSLIIPADKLGIEVVITIRQNGEVYGRFGCNNLVGNVKIKNNTINFNIAKTLKLCSTAYLEEEFLKQLNQVKYYEVINNILHLQNNNHNTILYFEVL